MSNAETQLHPEPTLSIDRARFVNDACERFEADWRSGCRPSMESFLAAVEGHERRVLLQELIALEVELRRERGEKPVEADYRSRFPAEASLVAEAFCVTQPMSIAGYELLDELGRGGMGVIYRARQKGLNRLVALKVMRVGRLATDDEARRFRIEAEAVAGLRHPNIVRIFDVGCSHGEHYFSMELIEGGNLSRVIPLLREQPRVVADLLLQIARAVHHAHQLEFVHRDLKPGNILLDGDADTPIEQRTPYITDFGLVKCLGPGSEEGLTRPEAIVGTLEYMAPEQAQAGPIDARTDVYGLGAILYAMLTGRPPHRADSPMETLVQISEREPDPPRRLNPGVPRALEAICLRCLEIDPERRYPSAKAVAEDLEHFLRGEPISAGRVGPLGRLRRWARREPELVFRLVAIGSITLLTQANYLAHAPAERKPLLHLQITSLELLWMASAILIQTVARRSERPERLWPAWIVVDVTALTLALRLLDAADSGLVIGYPMLVVASGLWSRHWLVWLTAGLASLGYALIWFEHLILNGPQPNVFLNIVVASLLVTAMIVSHQVRRLWSLSRFYERRPDPR
ncbi:serine/threonine-protein kinase [Tautonia marina]|uniref:serine/threonine-protein kinase n=1 Tax=Tautonia marina TaxID=2653855 RepID=UPI0012606128|nr:serine/threonine-protein kinase [Tautonia marina]